MGQEFNNASSETDATQPPSAAPGTRRRRWFVLGAIGVILVVVVAAVVWVVFPMSDSGSTEENDSSSDGCGGPSGVSSPVDDPKQGKVDIVDEGVSYVASDKREGGYLSFGVEVKNRSDFVAKDASVRVRVLDSKGEPVEERDRGSFQDKSWDLPPILPGQKFGFGGDGEWAYFGDLSPLPDGAMSLEVEVDAGEWWPQKNSKHEFSKLDTSDVTTDFEPWPGGKSIALGDGDIEDVFANNVEFQITSHYCDTVERLGASAVFRDSHGAIIGGIHAATSAKLEHAPESGEVVAPDYSSNKETDLTEATVPPGKSDPLVIFPAWETQSASAYNVFDDADKENTKVYPFASKKK